MKKGLYLIGGGGHCRACIDVIETEGRYGIVGIIDVAERLNEVNLGVRVVATDQDLPTLVLEQSGFLITIGQIESAFPRQKLFATLQQLGAFLPKIISPRAHVSSHAQIGAGTIVMHRVTVNAAASVGVNCILNTHAIIEHDAQVADHCHISTSAVVNGNCRIGSGTFIGSNSSLVNGVSVCADVVVGAGSVVHRDIVEPGVYAGNPCRRIR